jgi:hypothetical protein
MKTPIAMASIFFVALAIWLLLGREPTGSIASILIAMWFQTEFWKAK